jgi:hypothetical protein
MRKAVAELNPATVLFVFGRSGAALHLPMTLADEVA